MEKITPQPQSHEAKAALEWMETKRGTTAGRGNTCLKNK